MIRALLDINILLDAFLDRRPFADSAKVLLLRAEAGDVEASVVGTSLTTFFYVASKLRGVDLTRLALVDLLRTCQILAVDRPVLQAALHHPIPDFEDAVQDAAAENAGIDIIVTRDPKGFAGSTRRIMDAATLIGELDGTP